MAVTDEDQVRAMLESMGVDSTDAAFPQEAAPAATPEASPAVAPTAASAEAASASTARSESGAAVDMNAVNTLLEKRGVGGSHGREMTLSTLVHLLGLSTASQINLLDSKFDVVNAKLTTILSKVERLAADLAVVKGEGAIDRIDFALTEMRVLLKRLVPSAGTVDAEPKSDSARPSARAKILSSETPKAEAKAPDAAAPAEAAAAPKPQTKIIEKDNLEEFQTQDDASFQATQAKQVREQQSN